MSGRFLCPLNIRNKTTGKTAHRAINEGLSVSRKNCAEQSTRKDNTKKKIFENLRLFKFFI